MSAIFLSHSSKDNESAQTLKSYLEAQGHTVFLDCDPQDGILGGSEWERVLYERLHVCQAVIPLLSPAWISSRWCFAELVHARASGKVIVPVRIRECGGERVFPDIQEIDLTQNVEQGYDRLRRALHDVFPLKAGRPPYPGLATFTEDDAPVFFGRAPEIAAGLEQLESLRRRGRAAPRLLMVLGASGSGKSSLVRAGFIPRLQRSEREWLVVPVVRPRADPIDEIALSLAAVCAEYGHPRGWQDIASTLRAAGESRTGSRSILLETAQDLRVISGRGEATVLLVIDQAEELFHAGESSQAETCLTLLRSALDRADTELIVLATMRSDFLGTFQRHSFLLERDGSAPPAYDRLIVDPMPASRIPEVIRGPAALVALTVDDALVQQLTADMRTTVLAQAGGSPGGAPSVHTADALPLLAFALRRLWDTEQYRKDGRLDLRDYADSGRLEGTIRKVADEAIQQPFGPGELKALRAAFIPGLVQVTADGVRTRRRALRNTMPQESQALLDRLVDARLLTTDRDQEGRDTIEVTHEALFRMWPLLGNWLDEDQDKLRAVEGIVRAAEEWHRKGERADLLQHRDSRLSEVVGVLRDQTDPRFIERLDPVARRYLESCELEQQRRDADAREERERRVRDARTITFRTAIGLAAAVLLSIGLLFTLLAARRSETSARDQSRLALATRFVERDPTRAGLILQEIQRPGDLFSVRSAALGILAQPLALAELRHDDAVRWADISGDGQMIATASRDKTVRVWRVDGANGHRTLQHGGEVIRLLFSPDGQRLATSSQETSSTGATVGVVRVWGIDGRPVIPDLRHDGVVLAMAFSPAGDRLVTGSIDGSVRVWQAAVPGAPAVLNTTGSTAPIVSVAFDRSGDRILAAATGDRAVRVWPAGGSDADQPLVCQADKPVINASFVPAGDGSEPSAVGIVAVTLDGAVQHFQLAAVRGTPGRFFEPDPAVGVIEGAFSPKSGHAVTIQSNGAIRVWQGTKDGKAHVWPVNGAGPPLRLAGHEGPVRHVAISLDGNLLVTSSDDGTARVWRVEDKVRSHDGPSVAILHGRNVSDVAFSSDGQRVLSASTLGDVRLSDLNGGKTLEVFQPNTGVREAALNPRGDRILSVANDGHVRVWPIDVEPRARRPRVLDDQQEPSRSLHAAFSPDGSRIVVASEDGTARIWGTDGQGSPIRLHRHEKPLSVAAFNPAGTRVVTASEDGTARLWDAAHGGEAIHVFEHGHGNAVLSAAFSDDGARIVTGASDGLVRVWDVDRHDQIAQMSHGGPVRVAVFSPDGRRVLTASDDGIAMIWQADGKGVPIRLAGHEAGKRILSAEFSKAGTLVVTASEDATARVWSADGTGDPIILGHKWGVVRARFNPSADRVVTGSSDSRAIIWAVAPGRLLEIIRARTRVCQHPDFRVRYFLEDWSTAESRYRACEGSRVTPSPH